MSQIFHSEMAPAKLNLTLSVLARRADGYHDLASLVVFCGFGDELKLKPGSGFKFSCDGLFANEIDGENLVLRAVSLLKQHCGLTDLGEVHLTKSLPVAAGVGGGSSDAAALLRLAQKNNRVSMTPDEVAAIAQKLGADVPVCVEGTGAWIEGIGEKITQIKRFPEIGVLLVNPLNQVLTADVFASLQVPPSRSIPLAPIERQIAFASIDEVIGLMERDRNDMTVAAIRICPGIQAVLDGLKDLEGCRIARMSGSGATCFGLFETEEMAERGASTLSDANPQWWVRSTVIGAIGP